MSGPLTGTRVLDLTNVLAGPFCCHHLAHMGAEVIKVEDPRRGDLARELGCDPTRNARGMGISFLAQNAGKRSIAIDLKSAEGKDVLRRLVRTADVLVENFRPGVMDRLGLSYQALKEVSPDLVYCAITGFGQEGPLRDAPAYDQIIQGMSGAMSITGDAESAPLRTGFPMADAIGGMTAAFAIAAALAKTRPGRGTMLDVSMLDAVLATMGWVASNLLIGGKDARPHGNDNITSSPSGTFATGDGPINIAANKQEQFEALCRVIGAPELADDPRFRTREDRLGNRTALTRALEQRLFARPASDWVGALNRAGVPAGPVLTVAEALAHPQVVGRGLVTTHRIDGEDLGIIGSPVLVDGEPLSVESPPPRLGQHSDAILSELGYSEAERATLKERAVS